MEYALMCRSWKSLLTGIGAMCAMAFPARAADDIPEYEPATVIGAWYLRGDISKTNQKLHGDIDSAGYGALDNLSFSDPGSFGTGAAARIGLGYHFSDWLRFDITGQYRGEADFSAFARYSDPLADANPDSWDGTIEYDASKREWLFLANAYVDLGTWMGFTPYAGAGVGFSHVTISDFRQTVEPGNEVWHGGDNSATNFAWALHAGMGIEISDRLTFDLGYSYTDLGEASSRDLVAANGTNLRYDPVRFGNIVSHDVNFGLRYKFF
jgi:opacity protein-like surface antigen